MKWENVISRPGGYEKSPLELAQTKVDGPERVLDSAFRRAAAEKKPVFLFQLVGDLDLEGC